VTKVASEQKAMAQKLVNIVANNLLDSSGPTRPGNLPSTPLDQVDSLLIDFEIESLIPIPTTSFTSLPHHPLITSVDKFASINELRETAIALRGAKAGMFMDLLLVVGAPSFPLSIYIPLICNTGP
jgi:hypothetical protein